MRILLAEDDALLADGLARRLRRSGYTVDIACNAKTAEAGLNDGQFDVVLLDLGLPDQDGSNLLQRLRARRDKTPVLVVSARPAIEERVRLLDLGADDYLVKPVSIEELEARIRVVIRRQHGEADSTLNLGALRLDLKGKRAWLEGELLELTARDWALLVFLAGRPNRVLNKEQLGEALYAWDEEVTPNAVEKSISRLRSKIEPGGLTIRTIRGLGYFLEVPDDAPTP